MTLLPNGFELVYNDGKQLIAFNKERYITFYVSDIDKYNSSHYNFQKPIMSSDNIIMTRYNNIEDAFETPFCPFPTFGCVEYLSLYSVTHDDGNGWPFDVSMEKISQIPVLMEAIGEENRKIVEQTISKTDNIVKVKK